jgi:hypothetical protein
MISFSVADDKKAVKRNELMIKIFFMLMCFDADT